MFSFPPHCSHMMQPLDKTVYGPFKKFYAAAMKGWMSDNKGRPLGIYDVPHLVAKAYPKAMTPENITAGFKATGIYPHDRNIFSPDAFLPAQVTDRPDPTVAQESGSAPSVPAPETRSMTEPSVVPNPPVVSTSQHDSPPPVPPPVTGTRALDTSSTLESSGVSDPPVLPSSSYSAQAQVTDICASPTSSATISKVVTPSEIRPFTRAPPRKRKVASRSGSTRILTDTPVKNDIATRKQKKAKGKEVMGDSNVLVQPQSGDRTPMPVRKGLNYSTSDTVPRKRKCHKKLTLPKRKHAPVDDDNPSCLYCDGLYLESANEYRPWIQCQGSCKKWSHRVCAGVDRKATQFLCEFCISK